MTVNAFDYLNFDDVEDGQSIAVPNEIFKDFMGLDYPLGKRAYAYSYYYLSMYLHLYAKYGTEETVDKFTNSSLQALLGISPTSRVMVQITKKGGDLDNLGYTSTVTDYPIQLIQMSRTNDYMDVHHYMYSEEKKMLGYNRHSPNFTVKHPDKMYWRTSLSKTDEYLDGTLHKTDNTHMIPIQMFLHAMSIPSIMTKGFYIYGFIVYMSSVYKFLDGSWKIPYEHFARLLGVNEKTVKSIVKELERHGFIIVTRTMNTFKINSPNIYTPNLHPERVVYA